MLRLLLSCREGDRLWMVMFYLADRSVIEEFTEAAGRGVEVRLILDPNRDAFGYEKSGIPKRQAAVELVGRSGGAVGIRCYDTRGEQFHSKMVFLESGGGSATAILGSANLTRRNIRSYNLEMDVEVKSSAGLPFMIDIRNYFERIWHNRDGVFTVEYEAYADESTFKYFLYRFQEFTGLCSF